MAKGLNFNFKTISKGIFQRWVVKKKREEPALVLDSRSIGNMFTEMHVCSVVSCVKNQMKAFKIQPRSWCVYSDRSKCKIFSFLKKR